MTFSPSQMTYVHLVSWPSVWLPPNNTLKLLLLGWTQDQTQHVADQLSSNWPMASWAIYHVPDFAVDNIEHVDWLLINSHVENVVVNGGETQAMFAAMLLNRPHTYCVGDNLLLDRICQQHGWTQADWDQIFNSVLADASTQG